MENNETLVDEFSGEATRRHRPRHQLAASFFRVGLL